MVLYLCSALSLIVACAGCAAVKITHRAYIMVYGCCLGFIWLAVLITGGVLAGAAAATPMVMQGLCSQSDVAPSNAYSGYAIDRNLQVALNGVMCTATCPCPVSAKSTYDNLNATTMGYFNRTAQPGTGNNTANQIKMQYAQVGTVSSFQECWTTKLQA